jgi:gliding motility-associated-like protein
MVRIFKLIAFFLFGTLGLSAQVTPPHYYFETPFAGINNVLVVNEEFSRTQFLYRPQDFQAMVAPINGSFTIDTIFLRYGGGGSVGFFSYAYQNLEVRFSHTDVSTLDLEYANNITDPQELVIDAANYTIDFYSFGSTGPGISEAEGWWTVIPLETPFTYNGTDNLLVDWTFSTVAGPNPSGGLQMDFSGSPEAIAGPENSTLATLSVARPYLGVATIACPPVEVDLDVTLCPGDSFVFNGETLTTSGTYIDTLQTAEGCDSIIQLELMIDFEIDVVSDNDFNGFGLSCADSSDGAVSVIPSGGVAPYEFSWETGEVSNDLTGLSAGTYLVTVTDGIGCVLTDSITIEAPPLLTAEIDVVQPGCTGSNGGAITVANPAGGIDPYLVSLNGGVAGSELTFSGLAAGDYEVVVEDANGCLLSLSTTLVEVSPITFIVDPEQSVINLGESIRLQATTFPVGIDSIQWTPAAGLSCSDCPDPIANPIETTGYTVFVVDENGCTATGRALVEVVPSRRVYVPNAFTPDFDGVNDYFSIYGGPELERVIRLQVFDRWGGLVFDGRDLVPNEPLQGWDGTVGGRTLNPGTFVYLAEVIYLDGAVQQLRGDINLIR